MVLVDDQTGLVLMNIDLINEAKNRLVCDNANVLRRRRRRPPVRKRLREPRPHRGGSGRGAG